MLPGKTFSTLYMHPGYTYARHIHTHPRYTYPGHMYIPNTLASSAEPHPQHMHSEYAHIPGTYIPEM